MAAFGIQHPPDAELLAIDIGNTSITMGAVVGGRVEGMRSVAPDQGDALNDLLVNTWSSIDAAANKRVVIGSVVPRSLAVVRQTVSQHLHTESLIVTDHIALPMPVAVTHPDRVGVDRVCCAAAAYETLREACVVADFGTAVTIDLVSDDGVFLGGTISPGLALSVRALAEHTAALPSVDLRVPDDCVGIDTESALRAGIVYAAVGVLRETTTRFAEKIGRWPTLVVTGGDADLVADQTDFIDRVVPDLVLRGIALAYRLQGAPLASR